MRAISFSVPERDLICQRDLIAVGRGIAKANESRTALGSRLENFTPMSCTETAAKMLALVSIVRSDVGLFALPLLGAVDPGRELLTGLVQARSRPENPPTDNRKP